MHIHVIILEEFKPSSLEKISIFLVEHILKALMVGELVFINTIIVVSPNFKCKHHCYKLEVMGRLVLFMHLKLS